MRKSDDVSRAVEAAGEAVTDCMPGAGVAAVTAEVVDAGWRAHPAKLMMAVAVMAAIIIGSAIALSPRAEQAAQKFAGRNSAGQEFADLWLGGDVNLGDGGRGQLQDDGIQASVQGAEGIVNLEGPVAVQSELRAGSLRLWNSPAALQELASLNIEVADIANNHSGDAGAGGQTRSADALRKQGILPAGGEAGMAILRVNGLTIAVTAHDLTGGVPKGLQADLEAARKQADVLIATFHVTGPPSYLPRRELRQAVKMAYQAGALVIAAHGTHALGPVERRDHAVIAWGLGNMAFACDCTKEEDAMILRVRVQPGKVAKAEVVPIRAGIDKKPASGSRDAGGIFDLLEAIGSKKLRRKGNVAEF